MLPYINFILTVPRCQECIPDGM